MDTTQNKSLCSNPRNTTNFLLSRLKALSVVPEPEEMATCSGRAPACLGNNGFPSISGTEPQAQRSRERSGTEGSLGSPHAYLTPDSLSPNTPIGYQGVPCLPTSLNIPQTLWPPLAVKPAFQSDPNSGVATAIPSHDESPARMRSSTYSSSPSFESIIRVQDRLRQIHAHIPLQHPTRQPFPPAFGAGKGFSTILPYTSGSLGTGHRNQPQRQAPDDHLEATQHRSSFAMLQAADISAHPSGLIAPFRPSRMLLEQQGLIPSSSNKGYQGDLSSRTALSQVAYLPDHLNCAVWITNIPANMTLASMFDLLNYGSVFILHINEAIYPHTTRAAKLVFFQPQCAALMVDQAASMHGIVWGGSHITVRYNRDGYQDRSGSETRILVITGPEAMMRFDFWAAYFDNACVYKLDRVLKRESEQPDSATLEFRFQRVDGQAQTCYQKITRDPELVGKVSVTYGADPCDPANCKPSL